MPASRSLRLLRAIAINASLVVGPSSGDAQGMPSDTATDHIVRVTQKWGASSPLGALATRPMGADDVELRAWGGYGHGGSWGVVLRRTDARWRAWRARAEKCVINAASLPTPAGVTPTDSMLRAAAGRRCHPPHMDGGGTFYMVDTLALEEVDARRAGPVWEQSLRAGVLDLRSPVRRSWIMIDGFTIVIEVRRGDAYRVSQFAAVRPPEVAADSVARRVYRTVIDEFGRFQERRQ